MNHNQYEPLIPASMRVPEFTIKSIVISVILAIVLSAANAYLALKIGVTVSASIPASVLALGILRFFRRSNVLESNLIQTAASAGEGVAGALSFVLPAMVIMQVWQGFPYWETAIVTILGGLLGVLLSVPLRRVLLALPALRFPEGTAIGNVLKASAQGGPYLGLLVKGGVVGAIVSFLQTGLRIITDNLQMWVLTTKSVFGFALGFIPAVLASGYIVGFEVGVSLLVGTIVGWVVLLPIIGTFTVLPLNANAYDTAGFLWSHQLRFVGVGTMIVGGVWTLLSLLKPIAASIRFSIISLQRKPGAAEVIERTEYDMPIKWVLWGVALIGVLLFIFVCWYLMSGSLASAAPYLCAASIVTVLYVIVIGFLIATISGYFCGMIGSSNSPVSGFLIMAILVLAAIYLFIFHGFLPTHATYIASAVIIVATVVACIGAISGENIQDLKAGQMVGATPWRQQLMMMIGVVVSALILGPVFQLLFHAYGIGGVFPHAGMDHAEMLAAPQASLMAAVAQGVISRNLNELMIVIGGILAVLIIIIDEFLKRKNMRLPALAVGLGIYLPPEVIMPVVIGGFVSFLVKKSWKKDSRSPDEERVVQERHQMGTLMACGMVAGSALMGVVLAIPFVLMGSANALAINLHGFIMLSNIVSVIVFVLLCIWQYRIGSTGK